MSKWWWTLALLAACEQGADPDTDDTLVGDSDPVPSDTDDTERPDTDAGDTNAVELPPHDPTDPRFAVEVVSFTPSDGAGFGEDQMPDVVLGTPYGKGPNAGSLHVVSLGDGGSIVLRMGTGIVDGEGPDFIVFENAFPGWPEYGEVAVSNDDGVTWSTFPCAADGTGCAGATPVLAAGDEVIDPTDPQVAGGDAFDLADLGVTDASWIKITDSGENTYDGTTGGFDLDAVSVVNSAE